MIESDKPLRKCNFCGKEVRNLGFHIANQHPNIMTKLDESEPTPQGSEPPNPQETKVRRNTRDIINDYFEMMLQIQMMKQMSTLNGMDISDLKEIANPTKHEEFNYDKIADIIDERLEDQQPQGKYESTGDPVLDLAREIIPIIRDKKNEVKQNGVGSASTGSTSGLINP